ncbi:hypothetical protein PsYK624_168850 [Phanerochaete sordida]|uniref:Uncharacterized protein n=1 Tax=Phanerochaete sordida TaxID=48140 RepID=A0A9P3GT87_9APHY|nr:hypothetical protein PsYK624_168850 [Phanerochaete sordida]
MNGLHQGPPPILGFAQRAQSQLWYTLNFTKPTARTLPSFDAPVIVGDDIHARTERRILELGCTLELAWYNPATPWAAFVSHPGRGALYNDWSWLLSSAHDGSEQIEVDGMARWVLPAQHRTMGSKIQRFVNALMALAGVGNRRKRPFAPLEEPASPFDTADEAFCALRIWRAELLARVAYLSWRRARRAKPAIEGLSSNDLNAWDLWKRRGIPIAYIWSFSHQADVALAGFRAAYPANEILVVNAHLPPPRVLLEARSRSDGFTYLRPSRLEGLLTSHFHHNDCFDALERIDARIVYLDEPYSEHSAPPTPPGAYDTLENEDLELADDEERVTLADLLAFRVAKMPRSASNPPPSTRPLLGQLTSPTPEDSSAAGEDERTAPLASNLDRAHVVLMIDDFVRKATKYTQGQSVDELAGEVSLGADLPYTHHCALSFPAATELHFVYTLLANQYDCDRSSLWALALRHGLPFRPMFSEAYGTFIREARKDAVLKEINRVKIPPTWIKNLPEAPIPSTVPRSAASYCIAYWRAIVRQSCLSLDMDRIHLDL